jgi:hypothetical protein
VCFTAFTLVRENWYMRHLKTFGVLTVSLVLLGCSIEADDAGRISLNFGQGVTEEFRWDGALAAGATVEVKGVNGEVHAEPTSGDRVEVIAVKQSRRDDLDEVNIEVVEHEGGVTICAVYPDNGADEPNECLPGDAGHIGARRNSTSVEFTVRVPNGVHFVGRTVNGAISAEDMVGNVDIRTVNGSVRFSTEGYGVARTVNGSITGRLGSANWTDELEFESVNGSITLDFDDTLHANVEMRTVNGSLDTDFPLTTRGRISRRRLRGTIGDGGREITLSTVNGSIRLRRSM